MIEQATATSQQMAEQRIQEKLKPYAMQLALLQQIPGVDWTLAAVIIAELGVDMSVFGNTLQLASWAGIELYFHSSGLLRMWRTCNAVSRVIREFSKKISNLPASKSRRRITSEWGIRQNACTAGARGGRIGVYSATTGSQKRKFLLMMEIPSNWRPK